MVTLTETNENIIELTRQLNYVAPTVYDETAAVHKKV